ncbi:MAG: hypothetical protein JSV29_02895, partial [Candidatus Bathyarchaeota archaeon]
IKGLIRKMLMTRARSMPLRFERTIELRGDDLVVRDRIALNGGVRVRRLLLGDEIPVRYVPQSRYFQPQELDVSGTWLAEDALERLNADRQLLVMRAIRPEQGKPTVAIQLET